MQLRHVLMGRGRWAGQGTLALTGALPALLWLAGRPCAAPVGGLSLPLELSKAGGGKRQAAPEKERRPLHPF